MRTSPARAGLGVTSAITVRRSVPVFSIMWSTPGGINAASCACSSSICSPDVSLAVPSTITYSESDVSSPRRFSV
jgi:hypothetical protein